MASNRFSFTNGRFLILVASLLWGLGYFLRKLIVNDIHPLMLTFFVSLIVTLTLIVLGQVSFHSIISILRKQPLQSFGLSLFGVALGTTFMFLGLRNLDLSVSTLLEKIQPVFVVVLAMVFLKEKFNTTLFLFIVLALVSSYFVSTKIPFTIHFSDTELSGVLFVVLAAACWAISSIIGKSMVDHTKDSSELTFIRFGIASVLLLPFFIVRDQLHFLINYTPMLIVIVLFSSIICTGWGFLLYYSGLKSTTLSVAAFLELFTPVFSIFLGMVFLGETLAVTQVVATPVLLYSVYKISARGQGQ